MKLFKLFLLTLLLSSSLFFLNSCETWRSECSGEIIVENTIPDMTLYVGGESFYRDLLAPPEVFRHTEDKNITITALEEEGTIVRAVSVKSNTSDRLHAVEVTPLRGGESRVTIIADDGCAEKEINFTVTVRDTTR